VLSNAGTDVSKEAAKMILIDDNFATIILAIREGRRVWDNLVKILLYNMPANFSQGFAVFMAYVFSLETVPLTAIQVLYVNMITSVTVGLMLAMEPAEATIMQRPPRRKGKRLFGRMVMWHCVFVAVLIVASVLLNFQWELDRIPVTDEDRNATAARGQHGVHRVSSRILKARACAFNMLVFGELVFAVNCRSIRESSISMRTLTGNKWCWIAVAVTVLLQVAPAANFPGV
jgi:magnesium-transporting ATPase (P-type)